MITRTHTRTSITDVKIGDWVLLPGDQNNFFKVTEITAPVSGMTRLNGVSPANKPLDYCGENYYSVRVVAEVVTA